MNWESKIDSGTEARDRVCHWRWRTFRSACRRRGAPAKHESRCLTWATWIVCVQVDSSIVFIYSEHFCSYSRIRFTGITDAWWEKVFSDVISQRMGISCIFTCTSWYLYHVHGKNIVARTTATFYNFGSYRKYVSWTELLCMLKSCRVHVCYLCYNLYCNFII